MPDELDEATLAFQAGLAAQSRGQADQALREYRRCLELARVGDSTAALARGNTGVILAQRTQLADADRLLEQAIGELVQARELPIAVLLFVRTHSHVLAALGRWDEAEASHMLALEEGRHLRDHLIKTGDPSAAEAIDRLEREEAYSLSALGALQMRWGRFERAEALLTEAVTRCEGLHPPDPAGLASALVNRAQLRRERRQLREAVADAERAREQALQIGNRHELARITTISGQLLYRLGSTAVGIALVEEGAAIAQELGETTSEMKRRWLLASLLAGEGRLADAQHHIERGCELARFCDSALEIAEFYQAAANVASSRGDPSAELEHLERARAAWQTAVNQQYRPETRTAMASLAFDIYRRLAIALVDRGELERAFNVAEEGRAAGLRAQIGDVGGLAGGAAPAEFAHVADWIRRRSEVVPTAVVMLVFVPGRLCAFSIAPDGSLSKVDVAIEVDRMQDAFEELSRATTDLENGGAPFAIDQAVSALSEMLAPLFRGLAPRASHVIIMPTGYFWTVPWSTLLAQEPYSISIAPSGSWLVHRPTALLDLDGIPVQTAGFGTARGLNLADESRRLADKIAVERIAVDAEATPQVVREMLEKPVIVHVSAHGRWFSGDPGGGCLQLAGGVLTVDDLLATQARTPLAILSACGSGRAHVALDDDTVGLVSSLLRVGAGNAIASLWPVRVSAAGAFVETLFGELKQTRGLAQAVAKARAAVRSSFPDAADWGAFELFGLG